VLSFLCTGNVSLLLKRVLLKRFIGNAGCYCAKCNFICILKILNGNLCGVRTVLTSWQAGRQAKPSFCVKI